MQHCTHGGIQTPHPKIVVGLLKSGWCLVIISNATSLFHKKEEFE